MYTVYESKLNRENGEPVIERMVQREDERSFWGGADRAEPTGYRKTSTFRNRADAEKQNELLAAKGRKAALEFAKAVQERDSKTASTVTV